MNNKVVYIHRRSDTLEPFYVGMGTPKRPYAISKNYRSVFWNNIRDKYGVTIDIVAQNLSKSDAEELEIFLISEIGRRDLGKGPLVNLDDGGKTKGNTHHTKEVREKIRQSSIEKWKDPLYREKVKNSKQGYFHSKETRDKIRQSQLGKVVTDATRKKLRKANKGKPKTKKQLLGRRIAYAKRSLIKLPILLAMKDIPHKQNHEESIRKAKEAITWYNNYLKESICIHQE